MAVGTPKPPNLAAATTHAEARESMRRIDDNCRVGERYGGWFAPHEVAHGSPQPDLAVELDAGHLWSPGLAGGGTSRLTEVARQIVGGFTTPAAGMVRIDRVVVDAKTGVAIRVAGEAQTLGSPTAVPPAIPSRKLPVCQVRFTDADSVVRNRMITDERVFKNPCIVDAADFDGSNDYMLRGGALTGAPSAADRGILSAWLRIDGGNGTIRRFFNALGGGSLTGPRFSINDSNQLIYTLIPLDPGAGAMSRRTSATFAAGATWVHMLASWLTDSGPTTHLYVNDVSDNVTVLDATGALDWSSFTEWAIGVGNTGTGAEKWNGAIAELYVAPGQYLDFSVVANRRKFISAGGRPVFLGHDGRRPTGTAPLVYCGLRNDEPVANFALNRGTGGDFTITGTLEAASSSPSD